MFEIVQIITKEFLNDQEKAISVYGTQNIKNAAKLLLQTQNLRQLN
jgi:hypothetical protein